KKVICLFSLITEVELFLSLKINVIIKVRFTDKKFLIQEPTFHRSSVLLLKPKTIQLKFHGTQQMKSGKQDTMLKELHNQIHQAPIGRRLELFILMVKAPQNSMNFLINRMLPALFITE